MSELELLEEELRKLHESRAELLRELCECDEELAKCAMKVTGTRTGSAEHAAAKRRHEHAKQRKTAVQAKMASMKARIHMQAVNVERAKQQSGAHYGVVQNKPLWVQTGTERYSPPQAKPDHEAQLLAMVHGMSEIHDKYAQFAKDPTRINSMRHMASEVAREIAALLKGRAS